MTLILSKQEYPLAPAWLAAGFSVLILMLVSVGCSWTGSGGASALRIVSHDRDTWMEPQFVTAVYRAIDENTADIFLSDFEEDEILERMRLGSAGDAGTITQIRLFLAPKAGKTPIDFTASNVTITHVVMVEGAMGIYGGGGFLLPSSDIGSQQFGGRIRDASLRLLRSDEGFADLLGLAEMAGNVSARRDDTFADSISARMVLMMRR